jgi:hypothetical protein
VAEPGEGRGISRRPRILDLLGAGRMPEDEARANAEALVRRARGGAGRGVEGPAPDPDEVRERREGRIRRESRQQIRTHCLLSLTLWWSSLRWWFLVLPSKASDRARPKASSPSRSIATLSSESERAAAGSPRPSTSMLRNPSEWARLRPSPSFRQSAALSFSRGRAAAWFPAVQANDPAP